MTREVLLCSVDTHRMVLATPQSRGPWPFGNSSCSSTFAWGHCLGDLVQSHPQLKTDPGKLYGQAPVHRTAGTILPVVCWPCLLLFFLLCVCSPDQHTSSACSLCASGSEFWGQTLHLGPLSEAPSLGVRQWSGFSSSMLHGLSVHLHL